MATFKSIPYTYVRTSPRSKSAAAHLKLAREQHNTLDRHRLSAAAAAGENEGY